MPDLSNQPDTAIGTSNDPLPQLRVFLSYAHADALLAEGIAAAFQLCACDVWWDRHIAGGSTFATEIEARLESADVVVVLWSAASRGSHWVRDEAAIGRDRGILLPFRLDATEPPLGFRQTQTVSLVGWNGDKRDKGLLDAIGGALANWQGQRPTTVGARSAPLAQSADLRPPLIAVLTFTNPAAGDLGPQFAPALSEELLDSLAGEPGLRVLGRASTMQISEAHADPRFARERLGVAWLIEGSVRVAAPGLGTVTVSVRIIDTATGEQSWTGRFTRDTGNLPALQDDITSAVAKQLCGPAASPGDSARATVKPVASLIAKKAYVDTLVARHLIGLRQPESLQKARGLASGAIEADPGYALAYATRALATVVSNYYSMNPVNNAKAVARAARKDAEMAVALDPDASEAFDALAVALSYSGERRAAIAAAERAVALNANEAEAHQHLGTLFAEDAQFDHGGDQLRRAAQLDPLWAIPVVSQLQLYELTNDRSAIARTAEDFRRLSPDEAGRNWVSAAEANATGAFTRGLESSLAALAVNPTMRYAAASRDAAREALFLGPDTEQAGQDLRAQGRCASAAAVERALARGDAAWDGSQFPRAFSLAFIVVDRGPELLDMYRSRFDGADGYGAGAPVIEQASIALAFALETCGARAEAAKLWTIAADNLERARAGGMAESQIAVSVAALKAQRGDILGALAALEAGFETQWWAVARGPAWIGDLPLLEPLFGEQRFESILAACADRINGQRALIRKPRLAC